MPESTERGALTEAVFYILLTLTKPTHGYGIMKFVNEISGGRVILGSGTLYGAINTLLKKRWIRISTADSGRKKDYEITDAGREVLESELERLDELLKTGRNILEEGYEEQG